MLVFKTQIERCSYSAAVMKMLRDILVISPSATIGATAESQPWPLHNPFQIGSGAARSFAEVWPDSW